MAERESQKCYRKSNKGRKRQTELQKRWAKTEKGKVCAKRYRDKTKECRKVYNKKYYKKHRDKMISSHYERRYGLTTKQRKEMYLEQNGCCILCNEPVNYEKICTEHNHTTGKVRGLACSRCNNFIGYIETNSHLVQPILDYLEADYYEG